MRSSRLLIVLLGSLLLAGATQAAAPDQNAPGQATPDQPAAEQIDNPVYNLWMKSNVGSSVTMTMQITEPDRPPMEMESTRKLAEKADDHVTLETTSTMNFMGQKRHLGPVSTKIPARCDKVDIQKTGTEDVTTDGQTFHCTVYEVAISTVGSAQPGQHDEENRKAKVWIADGVPGGMVKMEAAMKDGTMTMLLKSFNNT